jgi:hypothetical protein
MKSVSRLNPLSNSNWMILHMLEHDVPKHNVGTMKTLRTN